MRGGSRLDASWRPADRAGHGDRWQDVETLFGPRGACAGCWCMWWRLSKAEYERGQGEGNRAALRALVESGAEPGLLACAGEVPVGWCALAPRAAYPRLARSRALKPVDELPVWSVTCLFVARPFRRRGIAVALLRAAAEYAAEHGATVVEGYPIDPRGRWVPDSFAYYGTVSAFRQAGFIEVARRSEGRPIMRRTLAPG